MNSAKRRFIILRLCAAAGILVAVAMFLSAWIPYARDRKVSRCIEEAGGLVSRAYFGPSYVPRAFGDRLGIYTFIDGVVFVPQESLGPQLVPKNALQCLLLVPTLRYVGFSNVILNSATVSSISTISGLRSIQIRKCSSDAAAFAQILALKNVEELGICYSPISSNDAAQIAHLKSLRVLLLSGTAADDASVAQLATLPYLSRLSIGETRISAAAIDSLRQTTSLAYLDISDTDIGDTAIAGLAEMHSLTTLWVRNTQITEEGRAKLRMALPRCRVLPK